MEINNKLTTDRRSFIGSIATGAAALTIGSIATPLQSIAAAGAADENDADAWFKTLKGKHRIVFDATRPHEVMPFAWPRVFMMTNEVAGKGSDTGVVVVLRHDAIPYAMQDNLWSKYKFGEMFKADDPLTKAPATRNPFAHPKPGDFKIPGVGPVQIGINELQQSGVMFCVCNVAMTVYSAVAADMMKMNAKDVYNEWKAGLLPGIQVVPSGVWAVGRAQEHGCAYCFAG